MQGRVNRVHNRVYENRVVYGIVPVHVDRDRYVESVWVRRRGRCRCRCRCRGWRQRRCRCRYDLCPPVRRVDPRLVRRTVDVSVRFPRRSFVHQVGRIGAEDANIVGAVHGAIPYATRVLRRVRPLYHV